MKVFGSVATILGFIVDSITLLSILLNFSMGFTSSPLANVWLGFIIAVLAAISYLGYLQIYWENNFEKQHFRPRFSSFLIDDILLGLRRPLLLIPPILIVILLVWLIFIEPLILIPTSVLLGLILVLLFVMLIRMAVINKPSFPPTTRATIENHWSTIEERIITELQRTTGFVLGIRAEDLKDIAVLLDVESKDMDYALIKFAMLNPEIVEYDFNYGFLHGRLLEALKKRPTKRAPDAGDSAPS